MKNGTAENCSDDHSGYPKIRILLVDDHRFPRMSLGLALDHEPDMVVTAQASTVAAATALLANGLDCTDVALLDLHLPDGNGITLIPQLKRCCPRSHAIVIAGDLDALEQAQVVAAGGVGFLMKDVTLDDVLVAIRKAARGESLLSAVETIELLRNAGVNNRNFLRSPPEVDHLTARELDVLRAVAAGLTDKEIGLQFHISAKTAHAHVTSILRKLDVHSRTQAIVAAVRAGLIDIR